MEPSLRAVLRIAAFSLLLGGVALGSVRLFRKGLPFPPEALALLAGPGFALLYLLRGSALSRRSALLLALAGSGVAAYFGAALAGLLPLALDPFDRSLFPGWSALLVSLAAGAALGALLFGPPTRAGPRVPPAPEPEGRPRRRER